jgi:hypothetical protein
VSKTSGQLISVADIYPSLFLFYNRRTIHSRWPFSTVVAHVVRFLTAKLATTYSPDTILKLQTALDANLSSHYASSWYPNDPLRGSALRSITLSPSCLPPNPVWAACTTANVQWFDWMKTLGNTEFDLFVDPGCVALRLNGQIYNIWSDSLSPSAAAAAHAKADDRHIHAGTPLDAAPYRSRKTLAQQLVEEDREDDELLFHLLNDKITSVPAWSTTPIFTQFSIPVRSTSPLSSTSEHSRCSSRSSNASSSGFSHYSGDTTSSRTSATSGSPPSSSSSSSSAGANGQQQHSKQSRRERARQARIFIDTSKKEVTPYDGGKTTVLTGGVMLGGAPKPTTASAKSKKMAVTDNVNATSNSNSRRSVRA